MLPSTNIFTVHSDPHSMKAMWIEFGFWPTVGTASKVPSGTTIF